MQRNIAAAYAALQAGRFREAEALAAPALSLPGGALLHALAQAGGGDVAGGAVALAAIARANPAARHPVLDLVALLHRLGRGAEAAAHLAAATERAPGDAGLATALGEALAAHGPIGPAVEAFERAVRLAPSGAAWANLGKALAAAGRDEAAEAAFGRAAALAPGDAQVTLNHAVARLRSGRWVEGWPLFRARHRLPGRAPPLPGLGPGPGPGPELTGLEGVAGRRVLLVHDEGLGDTLQFIRYAPLLRARGAAVSVLAPGVLRRLLVAAGLDVVERAGAPDAWVRIADLPGVFGTTPGTVPPALPLRVAPADRGLPPGRRIGLVWAGAARAGDPAAAATDRLRSIAPGRLGPLLGAPGVVWVSLQLGVPAPGPVFPAMGGVADFMDTAGIVAALDGVVSVDTAVAHLAAGMGKPVLLLDRFDNCWRWLSRRADTPWYPSMHILRQTVAGDWEDVLGRAAAMLAEGWPVDSA